MPLGLSEFTRTNAKLPRLPRAGAQFTIYELEQIAYALKQVELGVAVGGVCRKPGIAEATFYLWRKKHSGPRPTELKCLRLRDEENRKLRQLVDDPSLNKAMLQEVVTKSTECCPEACPGRSAQERFGSRERHALRIVSMTRSALRKRACLYEIVGRHSRSRRRRQPIKVATAPQYRAGNGPCR